MDQESSKSTNYNPRKSQNTKVINSAPSLKNTSSLGKIIYQLNYVKDQQIPSIGDVSTPLDLRSPKISEIPGEIHTNATTGICSPHHDWPTQETSVHMDGRAAAHEALNDSGKLIKGGTGAQVTIYGQNQFHMGRFNANFGQDVAAAAELQIINSQFQLIGDDQGSLNSQKAP
ncbi:hypothetical protein HAX54_012192 [Datura stramonium]|uniref:Uncharacterized protein n=1 Tax=Datura stramonium TaxID=4076 RepID=A0ABS8TL68_DATST|nr:hypothetical protein [Datura stramonium]